MRSMKIEDQRINLAAAMMAVSNYGHGVDAEKVLRWEPCARYGNSPRTEVERLAGHLMETEEHEDMFAGEAESWAKTIRQSGGLTKFADLYPHHAEILHKIKELG